MSSGSPPCPATLLSIRPLSGDTSLFTLQVPEGAQVGGEQPWQFEPGQFLQLSVPGAGEAPISYCGVPTPDRRVELCIRRVGRVTTALHHALPGDQLAVRGPFGRGFPLRHYLGRDILLVAGGLGMAPLRALLHTLLAERQRFGRLTLLYGAKAPDALLFRHELTDLAGRKDLLLRLAVDRAVACPAAIPSCREALLPELLDGLALTPGRTFVPVCGPPSLYRALIPPLLARGVTPDRIHLSLERRMQCGQGRCGHCAVGSLLCCTEGPVFAYSTLLGIEGAL